MVSGFLEWLYIEGLVDQVYVYGDRTYNVEKLVGIAPGVEEIPLSDLEGVMRDPVWGKNSPSPMEYLEKESGPEWEDILKADLRYPIIVAPNGEVADGNHRVIKAMYEGRDKIGARVFKRWEDMEPALESQFSEIDTPEGLLGFMRGIEYDDFGDEDDYIVQTPEGLLASMKGVCYDQVELERKVLSDYEPSTYFSYRGLPIEDNPTHTFLVYKEDGGYYWFENSWAVQRVIRRL